MGTLPSGFRRADFFYVFPLYTYLKHETPEAGQGHNLNKLGRGPLSNIKALGLVVSDKKIFSCFPYMYKPM